MLCGLLAVQLLLALALFATVEHNRWLTYQGGDQIWLTTTGWLVGSGTLPYALVSYGWPVLIAPLTWIFGGSSLDLLPVMMIGQVVVLGPLATLATYDIGTRIAGRVFGLWCAFAVVVAPYAATPLFVDRYRERWTDQVLVQGTGLTQLADYPSTVLTLVAAALVLRSIDGGRLPEAIMAGAASGWLIALKPSNALFLAGPAVAFAIARRWRLALVFGVSLLPAVAILAIWKAKGVGTLPVLALDETRVAAGTVASMVPLAIDISKSAPFDPDEWGRNMRNLREFFFSARLAQWAPIAGALAVARWHRPAAGLLLAWVLSTFLVKGSSFVSSIENASFWRLVMPALPAYVMLVAAIPLLVPTARRRLQSSFAPRPDTRPLSLRAAVVTAVVAALVPLGFVLNAQPQRGPDRAVIVDNILVPVSSEIAELELSAPVTERGTDRTTVTLSWTDTTTRARPFYRVYRTQLGTAPAQCNPEGADRCLQTMFHIGTTRERSFVDRDAFVGARYRIGVAANWVDDPEQGDVFALSPLTPPLAAPR